MEKAFNELVTIPISDIEPNPANPRKNDLGDLTEMADSIKALGIQQNLTVMPNPDAGSGKPPYRLLIGHRRLAAAKMAGLEAVPCMIVNSLEGNEQIRLMLVENGHREAFTVVQEADAYQTALDLGDTVSSFCAATGFSRTKVNSRLKIAELARLDREGLEKSCEKGGTLKDYESIASIKDEETKKELLQYVGTTSFNWQLKLAQDKDKQEEKRLEAEIALRKWALITENINTVETSVTRICFLTFEQALKYEPPQDSSEKKYIGEVSNYGVTLYVEKSADEAADEKAESEEREKAEDERRERRRALNEIQSRMKSMCFDFVKDFKNFEQKKATDKLDVIYELFDVLTYHMLVNEQIDSDDFITLYGLDPSELEEIENDNCTESEAVKFLMNKVKNLPPQVRMIRTLWLCISKSKYYNGGYELYNFMGRYIGDEVFEATYKMLSLLGYEISDTEKAMLDGTHEFYLKDEQE